MNPEICKQQCIHVNSRLMRFNTDNGYIPFIAAIDKKGNVFQCLCEMMSTDIEKPRIYDIHVKKDCPYWVEHELYDWDKSK